MKGEYVVDQANHMYSKLHQINKFDHLFTPSDHHLNQCEQPNTNDGSTIEILRRPRGRPPGSKNKLKPPLLLSSPDSDPSMSPYVIEIPAGADIVDCVTRFCQKRNTGLCILTGTGAVANVTLRQPSTTPGATVTFHGRFDILSISATVLTCITQPFSNGFAISLAGPQGQIVGGNVVGSLLAAGVVYIIAASFNNPSFHRLPLELEDDARNSGSEVQSPSGNEDSGHPAAESCGAPIYSNQLGCDVLWAPTARQAPPPF
jgi:predicted DNA-binding protein with PD1-like motif